VGHIVRQWWYQGRYRKALRCLYRHCVQAQAPEPACRDPGARRQVGQTHAVAQEWRDRLESHGYVIPEDCDEVYTYLKAQWDLSEEEETPYGNE
jgi:hypothetical protein